MLGPLVTLACLSFLIAPLAGLVRWGLKRRTDPDAPFPAWTALLLLGWSAWCAWTFWMDSQ